METSPGQADTGVEFHDAFRPPGQYSARLGGLIYRNVGAPLRVDGTPPITLHRSVRDGGLVPSFELITEDAQPVARIEYGSVVTIEAPYAVMKGEWGFAVLERANGRVWCDVRLAPATRPYELECSLAWYSDAGYPVMLHPDRTVLGRPNRNRPSNVAGFTMMAEANNSACAIRSEGGDLYLIDLALENFSVGIEVVLGE